MQSTDFVDDEQKDDDDDDDTEKIKLKPKKKLKKKKLYVRIANILLIQKNPLIHFFIPYIITNYYLLS